MKKKKMMTVYGDGINDDTEALQAWLDGEAVLAFPDGTEFKGWGNSGGTFLISKKLEQK